MEQYGSEASPPFPWYCPPLLVKLPCFGDSESENYTIGGKDQNAICCIDWKVIQDLPISSRARSLTSVICVSIQTQASAVRRTYCKFQDKKQYKSQIARTEEVRSDKWPGRYRQTAHGPVRKTSRHNMEVDPHQGQGNSCDAQNCQSRQDNPIVVVDSRCPKSKYAYEKMSNFSLYRTSLLTDGTNIQYQGLHR